MTDIANIARPLRRRPDTWKVAPVAPVRKAPERPASLLDRLLHRRQPSTFHRCLAVHMHFAAPHKTLS